MSHPAFGDMSRKPIVTGPTSIGRKPKAFFSVISLRCCFQNSRNSFGLGRVACRKIEAEVLANPSLIHWSRYPRNPTVCPHHWCATSCGVTTFQYISSARSPRKCCCVESKNPQIGR